MHEQCGPQILVIDLITQGLEVSLVAHKRSGVIRYVTKNALPGQCSTDLVHRHIGQQRVFQLSVYLLGPTLVPMIVFDSVIAKIQRHSLQCDLVSEISHSSHNKNDLRTLMPPESAIENSPGFAAARLEHEILNRHATEAGDAELLWKNIHDLFNRIRFAIAK